MKIKTYQVGPEAPITSEFSGVRHLFIEIDETELGNNMGSETVATIDVKHKGGKTSRFFFSINGHRNNVTGIVSTPKSTKNVEKHVTAQKQDFDANLKRAIAALKN